LKSAKNDLLCAVAAVYEITWLCNKLGTGIVGFILFVGNQLGMQI